MRPPIFIRRIDQLLQPKMVAIRALPLFFGLPLRARTRNRYVPCIYPLIAPSRIAVWLSVLQSIGLNNRAVSRDRRQIFRDHRQRRSKRGEGGTHCVRQCTCFTGFAHLRFTAYGIYCLWLRGR